MLKNLFIHEVLLLILGSLLFLILSGILVYYVIKKEEIKKLLLFFPISILMIAYPSIKELNISSDRIELITYQEKYENNPEDTEAKEKIAELTKRFTPRANSEEDLILIGKSNVLLEKPEKAIFIAQKVIENRKKDTTITTSNKSVKQAYQLKKIAEIQQRTATQKDTVKTIERLNNLQLDPELTKISSVVKTQYLKDLRKRSKSKTE